MQTTPMLRKRQEMCCCDGAARQDKPKLSLIKVAPWKFPYFLSCQVSAAVCRLGSDCAPCGFPQELRQKLQSIYTCTPKLNRATNTQKNLNESKNTEYLMLGNTKQIRH